MSSKESKKSSKAKTIKESKSKKGSPQNTPKKGKKETKDQKMYQGLKDFVSNLVKECSENNGDFDELWESQLKDLKKELKKIKTKEQKAEEKKEKKKNSPKRAKSAYICFSQTMRPKLKKENPDAKAKEIMSLIAEKWNQIKDTSKVKKYQEMANEDKKRYEKEFEEKNPGQESKQKERKRALNAYQLWMKGEMKDEFKGMKAGERQKELSKAWKIVDDKIKKKYQKLAEKEKEKFKKEKSGSDSSSESVSESESSESD